ncbi:MAG: hypothetical protein LAQ30_02970 [Acidobacteriia bacterium]|nr:hypothetical protein [Terriglobia bacterium]
MDLSAAIQDLCAEKETLERVIAELEALQRSGAAPAAQGPPRAKGRRGRTSMGNRERQQISDRMKAYWEARRKGSASQPPPPAPGSNGHSPS